MRTKNESAPVAVKYEFALIEDLLKEIECGRLRLPKFSRPFVWAPALMVSLFDSICKGYPIGNLLVWDTTQTLQSFDFVGPIEVAKSNTGPCAYVLDGHQRLATLFGVLRLHGDAPRGPTQRDWAWWIYYDLKELRFLHMPKGEPEPHWLPVRAILKTRDFLQEQQRIVEHFDEKEADLLIDEGQKLAQRVKGFRVAVQRIQGGSLEQVTEIFTRVNMASPQMLPDQVFSGLLDQGEEKSFDLAARIDAILDRLSDLHFGKMDRSVVFRAIVATAGLDEGNAAWKLHARKLRDKLQHVVDEAERGIWNAAEHLAHKLSIPGDQLLPYSGQFLLLAEFFRRNKRFTPEQEAVLRRWFWTTSFSGWFAGANTTQIRNALNDIGSLAEGSADDLKNLGLGDKCRPFPQSFDTRSARVRALVLVMLQKLVPKDWDGKAIDVGARARERGNRAFVHVFRQAPTEWVSNPANRILLIANRGKGFRQQLLDLEPGLRTSILESHGINEEAWMALQTDDAATFIATRARHLAQIERDFMTELGLVLPTEEFADADIDTDDE